MKLAAIFSVVLASALPHFLRADPETEFDKSILQIPSFFAFAIPNSSEQSGGYDNGARHVQDHTENGMLLATSIENKIKDSSVIAKWIQPSDLDQVSFSVIGHSMGGLITRALVRDAEGDIAFERLITLDTPHGGSGTFFDAPAFLTPALTEFALNGLSDSACQAPSAPGWNASYRILNQPRKWLQYSCIDAADDPNIVEPDFSAHGFGETRIIGAPITSSGWIETWVEGSRVNALNSHSPSNDLFVQAINVDPARIRECANFLARGSLPPTLPVTLPLSCVQFEAATLINGTLNGSLIATQGSQATDSISFDTNTSIRGLVLMQGASAQFSLTDSGASVILPTNVRELQLGSDTILQTFDLSPPPLGSVTVELEAGVSADASLHYSFELDADFFLVGQATPTTATPPGTVVQLLAWTSDATQSPVLGLNPTYSAAVTLPDQSVQSVALFDDGLHGDGTAGDGVFGELFSATAQPGRYSADFDGISTLAGESVQRSTSTGFIVSPGGGGFASTVVERLEDPDEDLLLNSIGFDLDINLPTAGGTYRVSADLTDRFGDTVGQFFQDITHAGGVVNTTVTATFDGQDIVRHAQDGPWNLDAMLIAQDAGSVVLAQSPTYTTSAFLVASFDPPPLPRIDWILPDRGPQSGGNPVILHGSGLGDATTVRWNGQSVDFTATGDDSILVIAPRIALPFVRKSQRTLTIPPRSGLSSARVVNISVVTPWGSITSKSIYEFE